VLVVVDVLPYIPCNMRCITDDNIEEDEADGPSCASTLASAIISFSYSSSCIKSSNDPPLRLPWVLTTSCEPEESVVWDNDNVFTRSASASASMSTNALRKRSTWSKVVEGPALHSTKQTKSVTAHKEKATHDRRLLEAAAKPNPLCILLKRNEYLALKPSVCPASRAQNPNVVAALLRSIKLSRLLKAGERGKGVSLLLWTFAVLFSSLGVLLSSFSPQ
jgi:hypothetical protein